MIAGGHSASDLCTDSDVNDKHGAQGFQSLGAGHPHADGLEFLFQLSPRVPQSPLWGFSFARSLSEINLASVIKRILSGVDHTGVLPVRTAPFRAQACAGTTLLYE